VNNNAFGQLVFHFKDILEASGGLKLWNRS